jgi:hypothetical protein
MKRLPYPPDGGLKEPVREFGETFNIWDVIRAHFGVDSALTQGKAKPNR